MFNNQIPPLNELPSSRQLLRSTLLALGAAGVLLVTVVMPAEYALDPTGAGRLLGLTQMGEVKQQLAEEAAADAAPQPALAAVVEPAAAAAPSAAPKAPGMKHEMSITLAPNQGAEIKLDMVKGARVNYFWTANGGQLNYDTHGDPYGAPSNFYHGYGKGRSTPEDRGVLEAAFDGRHGWFWRNRSNKPVTVTLQTEGQYISIERLI